MALKLSNGRVAWGVKTEAMRFQLALIARFFRESSKVAASRPVTSETLEHAERAYLRAERRLAAVPWEPAYAPALTMLFREQARVRRMLDRECALSRVG